MTAKPVAAALISLGFTGWTILVVMFGFAATDNALGSFPIFLGWLGSHWWAMLVSLVLNPGPIFRARQSITNAEKAS